MISGFLAASLFGCIYLVVCAALMNKFRREELTMNPSWLGKSGLEREFLVLWEVLITPFVILIKWFAKLASKYAKPEEPEHKSE